MNAIETNNKSYPLAADWKDIKAVHKTVPFSAVEIRAQQIAQKYNINISTFLEEICTPQARKKIIINVTCLEAKKVLKIMAKAAAIGAGIGFVLGGAVGITVGVVSKSPTTALQVGSTITAGGAATGVAVGTIIGVSKSIKQMPIMISECSEFAEWKVGLQKEQYDLLLNCLKNYAQENDCNIVELYCCISLDIPKIPVVSPNGHVYEKEVIEHHLDLHWAKVQQAIDSGYTQDQLKSILQGVCPNRGKPFKKEDLRYAVDFAKNAIGIFKSIIDRLQVDPSQDPLLLVFLQRISSHYNTTYQAVNNEVISSLTRDIINAGGTDAQRQQIIARFTQAVQSSIS